MKGRTVWVSAGALAGAALVLAGCVAQYRNPESCEDLMRQRFAEAPLAHGGRLTISHAAVAYQGQRVVVEGAIERAAPAAGPVNAASGAAVAGAASGVAGSAAAVTVPAASGVSASRPAAVGVAMPASVLAAASARPASDTTAAARAAAVAAAPTLVDKLIARFTDPVKKNVHVPAAVECTYDRTGLTSFRWLAPAVLATKPAAKRD